MGSAGDDLDITGMTSSKFNQFLVHTLESTSSTYTPDMTFDNTGGNDYARRNSTNGGTDTTLISQAFIENGLGGVGTTTTAFTIDYVINIDGEEKLMVYHNIASPAGAGTAPSRAEGVAKKDTTTDTVQFTRIDINNTDSGSFPIDSNISALGSEGQTAVTAKIQDGLIFEETDTNKHYIYTASTDTWAEV